MSSIEDVIHFFEMEIELAKQNKKDKNCFCFNGVFCDGKTAHKLNKSHIRYCKNIIERIKKDIL